MKSPKRHVGIYTIILLSVSLGGCASFNAGIQELDYPADLPILIGDIAYQINTIKCAQIKSIAADGALDCHDASGQQTATVTPVSNWRRNLVKSEYGLDWGSPTHQAFVFNFVHNGGAEKAAQAIVGAIGQSYATYASTKSMLNSIDKSKAIDAKAAQLKADGAAAYISGGTPAWLAFQSNLVQWRLENAKYFINQMDKTSMP